MTSGSVTWHAGSLASLLTLPARVVAVDIPLGLPVDGRRRACDVAARARLGAQRSSVFFAPPSVVLSAADHQEASALSRAAGSVGLSEQTWNLVPKIREASLLDDPRLLEAHPELSFRALGPVSASKKTAAGRAERLALLRGWLPGVSLPTPLPTCQSVGSPGVAGALTARAKADDCLDALACAWTAARWLRGEAEVLGEERPAGRLARIVV